MTDLGGAVDVLSTFRPSEKLLLDLYDCPDFVEELTWLIHGYWWQSFEEIDAVLTQANPGWTAWTPIYSSEPYYMLQCDFSYMIGPEMFDRFVKPELEASCRRSTAGSGMRESWSRSSAIWTLSMPWWNSWGMPEG
jgi:hypothetical protein